MKKEHEKSYDSRIIPSFTPNDNSRTTSVISYLEEYAIATLSIDLKRIEN